MTDQRTVLLLQQIGDGPWCCSHREISHIEVVSQERDPRFVVVHRDSGLHVPIVGVGKHEVSIKPGHIRIKRLIGNLPATVYAWS